MRLLLIASLLVLLGCPVEERDPQPTPTPEPTVAPPPSPSPTPSGTPAACPCLVRWGIGKQPHISLDENGNLVSPPVRDGRVVFDTTPRHERFPGDTQGGPCNAEQDNCNGRRCEDVRGPIFNVTGPSPNWRVNPTNNFQVKINDLRAGRHIIDVKPRPDLKDPQGVPVRICPQAINGAADSAVMDIE